MTLVGPALFEPCKAHLLSSGMATSSRSTIFVKRRVPRETLGWSSSAHWKFGSRVTFRDVQTKKNSGTE